MKGKIISLLKERYPGFVSGEEISQFTGVSRTAIWKHINALRQEGFVIESHTRVGYKLVESPDRPFEFELSKRIEHNKVIGRKIVYREEVDSTNNLARDMAEKGAPEGTVIIAEKQTAGKGRLGRKWHSPKGQGIWFSLILRPRIPIQEVAGITLMAAVAVTRAIRKLGQLNVGIKWPNDIILEGRKLAGILTEMSAETEQVRYIILGIGINFNLQETPEELENIAISIGEKVQNNLTRTNLLGAILSELELLYEDFQKGLLEEILLSWRELSITLGQEIEVRSLDYVEKGYALDIDEHGALLVRRDDGQIKKVYSGDVSIR